MAPPMLQDHERGRVESVPGFRIGHAERRDEGWLSGTTVVLCPPGGAVGGVDVRGGAPGTRETDLLDPRALVERVDAVVLTGGSAYGLAAATGVMAWLAERDTGFRVGGPGEVVPIVPAAVIFDLGRGGSFGNRPDAGFGTAACSAAAPGPPARGSVGAGTGAVAGGLKGGVGYAATTLPSGVTVAALVVVNPAGSCVDPATGRLYADRHHALPTPDPGELAGLPPRAGSAGTGGRSPLNTTLGVVLTDAALGKAACSKVAGVGHDGLARSISPAHTLFDGDTVFALASGDVPVEGPAAVNELLAAAANTVSDAVLDAMLSAGSAPGFPGYRDVFPSVSRQAPI